MLATLLLYSCRLTDAPVHLLGPDAFEQQLEITSDKIILDVRTPSEYRQGHLANAILVDVQSSDFREQVRTLDKSKPLFVYCASGIRSEEAVQILYDQGHTSIYELEGGFHEWVEAGKSFEKKD